MPMLNYPWPKSVVVIIDDVKESARVTVVIPRRFPFRDKVLNVIDESVAVAQQVAWMEYVYTVGNCSHHFGPDPDGVPGAGLCSKCFSRFDNVLLDPLALAQPDSPLTVEDIVREIDDARARSQILYPTCDDRSNTVPHLTANPARCECHNFASFKPGSFMDAINALNEITEEMDDEIVSEEELELAIVRVDEMLDRRDITIGARVTLKLALRRLHAVTD